MAIVKKCKGFVCGSNLIEGSITSDKLDKESLVELIKDILLEEAGESWLKEVFETVLKDSLDSDWLREFFKDLFEKYFAEDWYRELLEKLFGDLVKEEWFKDLICGMGCVGVQEVFDVIPTDITFEATGGTATVQVIVDEGAEWELTL